MPHLPICGLEAAAFPPRSVTEEMLALGPPWRTAGTHKGKALGLLPGPSLWEMSLRPRTDPTFSLSLLLVDNPQGQRQCLIHVSIVSSYCDPGLWWVLRKCLWMNGWMCECFKYKHGLKGHLLSIPGPLKGCIQNRPTKAVRLDGHSFTMNMNSGWSGRQKWTLGCGEAQSRV